MKIKEEKIKEIMDYIREHFELTDKAKFISDASYSPYTILKFKIYELLK